jgi:hypothetical protein
VIQLNPPIPMETPKGKAWAFVMINPSQEHHLQWVCMICETREIWVFQNPQVKIEPNFTMGY